MSDTRYKEKLAQRKRDEAVVWNAINATLTLAYEHGLHSARDANGGEFTIIEAVRPSVEKIVDVIGVLPSMSYESGYRDGYDDCEEDYE